MSRNLSRLLLVSSFLAGSVAATTSIRAAPSKPRTVIEIYQSLDPQGRGIDETYVWMTRLKTAAHHREVTKSAKNAYLFVDEAIQDVDFDMVFETPIAYKLGPKQRLFSILGGMQGGTYRVDYRKGRVSARDLKGPLSFATGITFTDLANPLPDESRGVGIVALIDANTGEFSHRTVGRFLAGLLSVADQVAPPAEKNGSQKDPGAAILKDFRQTLPRSMAILERYATISPKIEQKSPKNGNVTRAMVTFVLKVAELKRDYPALGTYVEGLIEALDLKANIVYRLASGEEYASIRIDGPKRLVTLECLTKDGLIIPRTTQGTPYVKGSFDPATITKHHAEIVVGFSAQLLGLEIEGHDIKVDLKFAGSDAEAVAAAKLRSAPTPKISGAFVGVLPTWAIDAFIPGSMEGYGKTFFDGLLKAKGTQGSFVMTRFKADGKMNLASTSTGTTFIDNSFLLIGLRMVQKHLWPNDAVTDDVGKIVTANVDAFHEDLGRLRTQNLSH